MYIYCKNAIILSFNLKVNQQKTATWAVWSGWFNYLGKLNFIPVACSTADRVVSYLGQLVAGLIAALGIR
jgi:hypothetical protein